MTAHSDKTIEQFRLGKADVQTYTLTETGTTYVSLKPGYNTMVTLNKTGSAVTMAISNDYATGVAVDSAVFGADVSTSTEDYQKGISHGFTGLKIVVGTYADDVIVIVTQYLLGD